ncbi:ubiquinone/menaquinone biosynthesis methyltransferase [bacterium]|nr:ubiquinone/menaquinone biosynthesis methyltransferase [bacterium]
MNKKELFNSIAKNYDRINDAISLYNHRFFRKKAINRIDKNSPKKILDLCCGTGDICRLLSKKYPDAKIIGVDFSANMLEIARKRLPDIEFIEHDIHILPFCNETFDICTISFGLRNVDDLQKVIKEIHRVLKPDGIFLNLDLGKPNKFWNIFLKPYMYVIVPILGKFANGSGLPLKYFVHSNETFPAPDKLKEIYSDFGLIQIQRFDYLFGQISCQICKKIMKNALE